MTTDDPKHMTLDEFGRHLFETIKVIAKIEQYQKWRAGDAAERKPEWLQRWRIEETELLNKLPGMMGRLTEQEATEIYEHYPWVAEL